MKRHTCITSVITTIKYDFICGQCGTKWNQTSDNWNFEEDPAVCPHCLLSMKIEPNQGEHWIIPE